MAPDPACADNVSAAGRQLGSCEVETFVVDLGALDDRPVGVDGFGVCDETDVRATDDGLVDNGAPGAAVRPGADDPGADDDAVAGRPTAPDVVAVTRAVVAVGASARGELLGLATRSAAGRRALHALRDRATAADARATTTAS